MDTNKLFFFPAIKEAAIKVAKERNEPVSIDDPEVQKIVKVELEEYESFLCSQYDETEGYRSY